MTKKKRTLLIDDLREIDSDVIARTFEAGMYALQHEGPFDILYLDHDLGDDNIANTGYKIISWLEENLEFIPKEIILVTANPVGRRQMEVVRKRIYKELV